MRGERILNKLRSKAKRKINQEFQRYKRAVMMYEPKVNVWESSHKIHFYCCIREYFHLNPKIPNVYLELAVKEYGLIQSMWNVYLKHEELQYYTWEGIEDILEHILLEWKIPQTA